MIVKRIDQRTHDHSTALETMGTNMKAQMTGINDSLGTIAKSVEAALEPEQGYVNKLIEVLASREKTKDWLPTVALILIGVALIGLLVAVFRIDLSIDSSGAYHLGAPQK